ESPQVSAIALHRCRLIVNDPREASARLADAALLDQHARHMPHHLYSLGAKLPDETAGRGAVAFTDHAHEQVALRLAIQRLRIERTRGLADQRRGDAAEISLLAREQQEVHIFTGGNEAFVESAASLEDLAAHHELTRHDVPRPREHLRHRRRIDAI